MTWDHPRGLDPLVACSRLWQQRMGVDVVWEQRSLQDFESLPVRTLAQRYDLIVIDHPHVGQITREQCLLPLDRAAHGREHMALEQESVGGSFRSYVWEGRLWALPIDAAAQVQAIRPDRLGAPIADWASMLELARQHRVQCPMRPPHNLMSFYTLCGLLGRPGEVDGPMLIEPQTGAEAYELLRELISHLDRACFSMDPIAVLEAMSVPASPIEHVPLIYGYVSYSRGAFRSTRLAFADIPVLRPGAAPQGSALGGTGIAVSACTAEPAAAVDFAYWIASAPVQRGPYAGGGGQPASAAAWADPAVNEPVLDFYRNTQRTLAGSWIRPRHDGYMQFQEAASQRLLAALRDGEPAHTTVSELNRMYRVSLPSLRSARG